MELIKEEQFDEIIYIGDIINASGISKYTKKDMEQGIYDTLAEFEDFKKDIHDKIKKLSPKSKIVWINGNHDGQRVEKAINEMPERKEILDLKKIFPGVKIVRYGSYYKVGDLYFTHGNKYGDHSTKQTLLDTMKNTVFGHTHTVAEYTKNTMVDDDPIFAKTIGCLCERDASYKPGEPNKWVNAFHVSYIRPDGKFYETTIRILKDGNFMFNGKVFRTKKK
jgi:metallophosphoesterase superfamily enzyme